MNKRKRIIKEPTGAPETDWGVDSTPPFEFGDDAAFQLFNAAVLQSKPEAPKAYLLMKQTRGGTPSLVTPKDDRTADNKTDNPKKSRKNPSPENTEVLKLAKYIKRQWKQRPSEKKTSLALEFTNGDNDKAESLLRQLRRFPHLLN
jgi:hypothetical protein